MARKPSYEELEANVKALENEVDRLKNTDAQLARYHFVINSVQDAIFLKDLESRYLMANSKTIEAFGLSEAEVIGKNDYEIMPDKNEAEKNVRNDQAVFKSGKHTNVVKHMTGADGKEYWFEAKKTPRFDNGRNVIGLVGFARDITDQQRAEEALKKSREELRAILDATIESIVLIDREGIVRIANETFCTRLKVRKEELIGKVLFDFLPPKVAKKRKRMYEKVLPIGTCFLRKNICQSYNRLSKKSWHNIL